MPHVLTALLYRQQVDDPGSCYAVQGAKEHLHWFGNYLLVVSNANAGTQGRTARNGGGAGGGQGGGTAAGGGGAQGGRTSARRDEVKASNSNINPNSNSDEVKASKSNTNSNSNSDEVKASGCGAVGA